MNLKNLEYINNGNNAQDSRSDSDSNSKISRKFSFQLVDGTGTMQLQPEVFKSNLMIKGE